MQKELLLEMLAQNKLTCSYAFDRITDENSALRLNRQTASIGFIYRHIGETMNLFGFFFGIPTDVQNSTMEQQDIGQQFDLEISHQYVAQGYAMLKTLVADSPDSAWLDPVHTPFFGTVSKMRLFSHVLFHTSHHAGQISLTLAKGQFE
ncbi:MAG: DinB family protein [Acidobacteria bacterium]|nr:DinB family protein [Acidobacteriota bacterium]